MKSDDLFKLLNQDEVRGRVIRDAASLEDTMGLAIMFYFTTNKRFMSFEELVLSRLGFNDKVTILEKIPYKKRYKSLEALEVVRHIQRVRNIMAHRWHISDYGKKINFKEWEYLFESWPKSYEETVNRTKERLGRIVQTNEFIDHFAPNRKNAPNK